MYFNSFPSFYTFCSYFFISCLRFSADTTANNTKETQEAKGLEKEVKDPDSDHPNSDSVGKDVGELDHFELEETCS